MALERGIVVVSWPIVARVGGGRKLAGSRCDHQSVAMSGGNRGMTAPSEVLVAARGAGRRYARRVALAPIELEVRAGECVALLGPNGAGKTTLLTLLAGAAQPTDGRIERASGRTGWVPQRPALYRKLSARARTCACSPSSSGSTSPHAEAERLLESVDLVDAADRPAQELSVGNVQRLNVAIGLVADPAVVFLDEPTASLDPRQRARLWELLRGVTGRGGAVVFATQNVEEAHTQADRLVVLQEGRLVFAGAAAGVLGAGGHRGLERRGVRARVRAVPRGARPAGGDRLMRAIRALLAKDLRILRRSPLMVALLVVYPLALAVLVGAVIADAGARPRVAFVDLDHLPERASVGTPAHRDRRPPAQRAQRGRARADEPGPVAARARARRRRRGRRRAARASWPSSRACSRARR